MPYELTGKRIVLVVDPHLQKVLSVEDDNGDFLGAATPLDVVANVNRKRRKPRPVEEVSLRDVDGENEVELAYRQYHDYAKGEK